jgi:hypothetical protein
VFQYSGREFGGGMWPFVALLAIAAFYADGPSASPTTLRAPRPG